MSNRVNPPKQLVLPNEVAQNASLKKAFDDRDYILFQMWKRLGGGNDLIADLITQGYEFDDLSRFKRVDSVPVIEYGTTGTTSTTEVAVCNNTTLSLNDEPCDNEKVTVKVNGDTTVSGNGKLIDGLTSITFVFNDFLFPPTLELRYKAEFDYWITE